MTPLPSVDRKLVNGFTLVELLVVIAIIGILIALMLPAIQSSRESARSQKCCNNLHQLAVATLIHEATHGHFPSGGWGASWTGDTDRGYAELQPGGWTYNILSFIEQRNLHDTGAGLDVVNKRVALRQAMQQPLESFHCPSRRPTQLYANARPYKQSNADPPEAVARSDYAINAGDRKSNTIVSSDQGGPLSLADGDTSFPWPATADFTGVSFLRSRVRVGQIIDGTAQTYLIGEKSLDIRNYSSGLIESDRGHLLIGFAPDTVRLTANGESPHRDSEINDRLSFGSAHPNRCFFAFCDGSVRGIDYDIDPEVHRQLGNRKDGN